MAAVPPCRDTDPGVKSDVSFGSAVFRCRNRCHQPVLGGGLWGGLGQRNQDDCLLRRLCRHRLFPVGNHGEPEPANRIYHAQTDF